MNKVCIIGAGSSGIAACKALGNHGIDYDCFEKGSDIGGLWKYNNDNGLSSAYKSLHMNTSKFTASYISRPMPDSFPIYPHHSLVHKYLKSFAQKNDLLGKIVFNTGVKNVFKNEHSQYIVETEDGKQGIYSSVIVASGQYWNPIQPKIKGYFQGEQFHSHYYRTAESLKDKNVIIVGLGASGVDIASEVSRVAKSTTVSLRSIPTVLPKFLFGQPLDVLANGLYSKFPAIFRKYIGGAAIFLGQGQQEKFGFPKANGNNKTVSSDFLNLVGHGKIIVKPNIKEAVGDKIIFEDNSSANTDVIIHATGYKTIFPFFSEKFLNLPQDPISLFLYKRMVHPIHNNLFFIGFFQPPTGSCIPIVELQTEWIAKILVGQIILPSKQTMATTIQKFIKEKKDYYKDDYLKYGNIVDYNHYLYILKRLLNQKV